MEVLKGKNVSEGIAIGRICIFDRENKGKRGNTGGFERKNGDEEKEIKGDEPVILVADDLASDNLVLAHLLSGETVQMEQSKVSALVFRHGSTDSHIANLARSLNIPALVGVEFADDMDHKMAVVDGYEGLFYVEPTEVVLEELKNRSN